MRLNHYSVSFILAILLIGSGLTAQAQTMQEQFTKFKSDASKWEEYTMIKHPELDRFWKVVSDTLNKNSADFAAAQREINDLSAKVDGLEKELQEIKDQLAASENVNASIGFLGIQVNKTLYNLVVWLIIAGLCLVIGILYVMYGNSNKVTKSTKEDIEALTTEFNDYKEKATKKQISLKRELQTAINTLEENRIKISQKLGYNKDSSTIS